MIALLISILKTTRLPNKWAFSKNDGNNPAFAKNNDNNKIWFSDNNIKYTKKSEKLKYQKLAKSQKLSKLEKSKSEKLLKSRNLPNFNTIKARSSFLTPDTKTTFNYL